MDKFSEMNFRVHKTYTFVVFVCTLLLVLFYNSFLRGPPIRKPLDKSLINRSLLAQNLPKEGTLFCFVMTIPDNHDTRAYAVNETWLNRCTHGEFFSTEPLRSDMPFSTAFVGMSDDYKSLFLKTKWAFYYAYKEISDSFDWYMKADDDTYIIMEHLAEYLNTLDPTKPQYLGYRIKEKLKYGHNSGSGYILSNEAVKRFIDFAYDNKTICPDDINEDRGMARCLANIGIIPRNTLDEETGTNRFNAYRPDDMFHGKIDDSWHYYPPKKGHDWASRQLISMHHLTPDEIRIYDNLLYRVKSPQLSQFYLA